MKTIILAASVPLLALFAAACTPARSSSEPLDSPPAPPAGDTFFTGCAFLDKNANRLVDSEDAYLGDMSFMITLSGGAGFAASTQDTGCATVTIPAPLRRDAWPIAAHMEMPQKSAYIPIGDIEITLAYPNTRADFLFSLP